MFSRRNHGGAFRRACERNSRACGESFNILSPKQLSVVLFEKLCLPPRKKTKTGYSTDSEVLEGLKTMHPIVGKVLEYRFLTKLKSTFIDAMLKKIGSDGRIRTTLNQNVTATGRISSQEPNLQNIPVRTELDAKSAALLLQARAVFLSGRTIRR